MTQIQRALLSVSDKDGLVDFAQALAAAGVELLSTGGTAKALRAAGLTVTDVAGYTGSPEVMGGRVKTLHPRVHGALLRRPQDAAELEALGGKPIDLLCVNLYPFAATVARGAAHAEAIEQIDIGGPAMLRSAAKNHQQVTVLSDPADYPVVAAMVREGKAPDLNLRAQLAAKAFAHTAAYDAAIAGYLSGRDAQGQMQETFAPSLHLALQRVSPLRYGENPHQAAAFYRDQQAPPGTLAQAVSLNPQAKALSYNNWVDLDAAWEAVRVFAQPAAVVVKHTNPCGVAVATALATAYERAREADSLSAFGGIVALNRRVDLATATKIVETFIECVVAPEYDSDALHCLQEKRNLRVLAVGDAAMYLPPQRHWQRLSGGFLVQDGDQMQLDEVVKAQVPTRRQPNAAEIADLDFAWRVCQHVKSNAIVLAKDQCTVGVGAGQMSRVVSVELAVNKAAALARGAVLASDAFFPFADGLEAAARAGVTAVVQPGGSKRDSEVIAAADVANIAMVFAGVRHFRH